MSCKFLSVGLLMVLLSCSGDNSNESCGFDDIDSRLYSHYESSRVSYTDTIQREYYLKLLPYCYTVEGWYLELHLSESEASVMGIPAKYYRDMVESIEQINKVFENADTVIGIKEIGLYYDAVREGLINPLKESTICSPRIPSLRKRISK